MEPSDITLDITLDLARASGFKGVVDLPKVAKHGRGENIYLIRFHFIPPGRTHRSQQPQGPHRSQPRNLPARRRR